MLTMYYYHCNSCGLELPKCTMINNIIYIIRFVKLVNVNQCDWVNFNIKEQILQDFVFFLPSKCNSSSKNIHLDID